MWPSTRSNVGAYRVDYPGEGADVKLPEEQIPAVVASASQSQYVASDGIYMTMVMRIDADPTQLNVAGGLEGMVRGGVTAGGGAVDNLEHTTYKGHEAVRLTGTNTRPKGAIKALAFEDGGAFVVIMLQGSDRVVGDLDRVADSFQFIR